MRLFKILLVVFCFHLAALPPLAPGAGVIEREMEKEYEAKPLDEQRSAPIVDVDIPEEKLSLPEGKKVFIRSVTIEGNQAISTAEILRLLNDSLHQELSIADIYGLCSKIDQHYAAKGYFLARAYPPPQNIQNGKLIIRVLEGKIGSIRVEGNTFYKTAFIRNYFSPFCKQSLHYDQLIKALLLLNENADLSAGILFEKGKEAGTADLIVRVKDARPIHFHLNENNYGKPLTSSAQLGGRVDWGSLFFQGDSFSVAQVVGFPLKALYFSDLTYKVPLNTIGTSVEVGYLLSKFDVAEMKQLQLKGRSTIGTIKAVQAITRTKNIAIDLFSYFDYKQIKNFMRGQVQSDDKLRVLTAGATLNRFNVGRGRDFLNFRIAAGIPRFLGGLDSVSEKSSRKGGGGRFVKLNLDYNRVQQLYKEWTFNFHTSGQWSPSLLAIPEQIYIGGSSSVRGYPLSAVLGDSGFYANFETRFPLPLFMDMRFFWTKKKWKEAFQLIAFVDTGLAAKQHEAKTCITGTGMGFRLLGPYSLSLSFDIGFPLNHKELSAGSYSYLKITGQPF